MTTPVKRLYLLAGVLLFYVWLQVRLRKAADTTYITELIFYKKKAHEIS